MRKTEEIPVVFDCEGEQLVGIIHVPEQPSTHGLLCVVAGGPQYRIGCCRQQVQLARRVADSGTPVMRFDYRSMGDASGDDPHLERSADISAAIDEFARHVPGLTDVVLYGGCDGASAIAISGWRQPLVSGWILNNPFTANEEAKARVLVKHYYRQRLLSPDFWKKVFTLKFNFRDALHTLLGILRGRRKKTVPAENPHKDPFDPAIPFTQRMLEGWKRFNGDVLILIGGRSLVAKEFDECVASSAEWQKVVGRDNVERSVLADADHTFSEPKSKEALFDVLVDWFARRGSRAQRD